MNNFIEFSLREKTFRPDFPATDFSREERIHWGYLSATICTSYKQFFAKNFAVELDFYSCKIK